MRREPTEFEMRLWRHLSNSQLGGWKFRRQALIGGRIVDFFCPAIGLAIEVDGVRADGMATGDGGVDATFAALRQAFPHEVTLKLYAVQAVTSGTDAQARVTVRLEEDGKMVDGQGADTDTIVASARAYVHALNKLLVKRQRTEPPVVLRA